MNTENTTMTNDCKTCPVSTGTHKPTEAMHQIDEPQADALRLAAELVEPIDGFQEPTMLEAAAAAELHRLHARITELESQLEAIGAGGVEPLRKQVAAPQAVPGVGALYALQEAEAALELAIHRILKRDPGHAVHVTSEAKALVAVRAALDTAAPAHPAEGVANEDEAFEKWWSTPHVWGLGHKAAQRSAFAAGVAHAAATQPAAQGMEADLTDEQIDEAFNQMPDGATGFLKSWGYRQFARAVLAAQAKQGGV